MKHLIILMTALVFSGCSTATLELLYNDAKVVYKDAKYVVHEYAEKK